MAKVTNEGIEFAMVFKNPLEISQGDEPDEVMLILNLSKFKAKNGSRMRSTILTVLLPRQMNIDEAATIEAAGSTAESASTAAVGTNFVINIMLSASLN